MARDYIDIGSSPSEENCVQVGTDGYAEKARKECNAYRNQLRRMFGAEPEGADLRVKRFSHDFGGYYEVICWYDDLFPESVDYAFRLEAEVVEKWDEEALKELAETANA